MFNSYLQLELRRKNIWHAGHHKTTANFKPVAYVHKRCWSKYNDYLLPAKNRLVNREVTHCQVRYENTINRL